MEVTIDAELGLGAAHGHKIALGGILRDVGGSLRPPRALLDALGELLGRFWRPFLENDIGDAPLGKARGRRLLTCGLTPLGCQELGMGERSWA